ncbi:hypothetical protein Acsp05_21980 [Actinokineospora sp. NBRC 105648]|nr:hypothetical protein Acsp05_21980 [Actinokineospora sp. NBRC 105648]
MGTLAGAVPATAEPYCGITWGSTAKTVVVQRSINTLYDVRAGRHDCYDRVVIELTEPGAQGFDVRYVDQVIDLGTGAPVPLRGGARLRVSTAPASVWSATGHLLYDPPNPAEAADVRGFQTFRQIAFAGDDNNVGLFGLGVRARLPFRAFWLDGDEHTTQRLVVDVAHQW